MAFGCNQGLPLVVGTAVRAGVLTGESGVSSIDHYTPCILGDGCMQGGASQEPCAYASHSSLGKLIAFYDGNGVTIDGRTGPFSTEDVGQRCEAYGWQAFMAEDGSRDVDAVQTVGAAPGRSWQ